MSSHEIKTPVLWASLHVENLLDDIESWNTDKDFLIQEVRVLKEQIFKISDLVVNIFSVQKHEINDVWLYIEKIKLSDIIIWEYDILHRIYPDIEFDISISNNIWFVDIDKVQFTQVISNLLYNAVKFVNKNNPKININLNIIWENIEIIISDNWKWFINWDENIIFEKYSTWNWKSVWIWMWLYLCKKIVELHLWKISANKSKLLWWAEFKIIIPIIHNK
jgi:K+-sensing histidine kinase KdpD